MVRKTARERLAQRDERARSELFDLLFEPWIGAGNNPATVARLGAVDAQDAAAVRRAITDEITPGFEVMTRETQGRIRTALTILGNSDGAEFRTYWLDLPPPFGGDEEGADAVFPVLAKALDVKLPEGR